MNSSKKFLILTTVIVLSFTLLNNKSYALSLVSNLETYQTITLTFINTAALILFTWSTSNILFSAIQFRNNKYFHLTNILWCLINLAIVAYMVLNRENSINHENLTELLSSNYITQNIVSLNIILDLIYIFIGKKLQKRNSDKFVESGKAIVLQGKFLFIFDIFLVLILVLINTNIFSLIN